MNTCRQLLSIVALVAIASTALADDGSPALQDQPNSDVRLLEDHDGELILTIERPWKAFTRPSIEVCLVPDTVPEAAKVHPIYFVSNHLKGEVLADLYRALDEASEVPVRRPITDKKMDFEMVGNRNSLGKAAVCVACRTEPPVKSSPDDETTLARATFCLLEHWSVEPGGLYLNLPADYFSVPGRLHIWLLRDNQIVWSHTIRWPGIASGQPPAAEAKQPAAKAKQ